MNSESNSSRDGFFRFMDLLERNIKLVLTISFILFLIIPINSTRLDNLWTLVDGSISRWVNAIRDTVIGTAFANGILDYLTLLTGNGIERTIVFFQSSVDFYIKLATLDLSIIAQAGILLTCIYLLAPLLIIYIIWKKISQNKPITDSFVNLLKISPKGMLILLLIIPVPSEYTWIGAIFTFVFLLYWLFIAILEEKEARKGAPLLEVILWKKCTFVLASAFILLISVYEKLSNKEWSVATFVGVKSNEILIISLIILAIIWVSWLITQVVIKKKSLQRVIIEKYDGHFNTNKIILAVLSFVVLLPIYDALYIQTSATSLVFVIINIPWILVMIFHDPFFFVNILVTAVFDAFNTLYTACRDIVDRLIPVNPNQISIIRNIEPTIIFTLIIFSLLIIIIIVLLVFRDLKIKSEETNITFFSSLKKRAGLFKLSLICLFFAFISWIFKPDNYESLFGDRLNMVTDPLKEISGSIDLWDIIGLALMAILVTILISVFYWMILQYRKGRSLRIISTIVVVNILAIVIAFIMVTPFIWMIKNSVQTFNQNALDFQRQGLLPDPFTMINYAQILSREERFHWKENSFCDNCRNLNGTAIRADHSTVHGIKQIWFRWFAIRNYFTILDPALQRFSLHGIHEIDSGRLSRCGAY